VLVQIYKRRSSCLEYSDIRQAIYNRAGELAGRFNDRRKLEELQVRPKAAGLKVFPTELQFCLNHVPLLGYSVSLLEKSRDSLLIQLGCYLNMLLDN
jgi:hypothetical protein